MRSTLIIATLVLAVTAIFLAGCNTNSPEGVVKRMYEAISKGDTDKYMDTILPENRRQPNPFGLINAISIGIDPISLDLSKITAVSVRDLKLSIIATSDDYALVQAKGKIRYPILTMELDFCDQHDVRNVDGTWYVDVYAPERATRLEEILGLRQQELADMANDLYYQSGLFGGLVQGMESALDLCK